MQTIIPAVKARKTAEGVLCLNGFSFLGEHGACDFAKTYLQYFFKSELFENAGAPLVLSKNPAYGRGRYALKIGEEVEIEYAENEGLRNALATLLQLLKKADGGYLLRKQTIEDEPSCAFRSVLIDLARGLPDISRLKEDMLRLSLAKCNYVHLHIMDSMGLCYQSEVMGNPDDIRGTALYTKADMKALVAYAESLGIELIPELEIPAHANRLTMHEGLACTTELEDPSVAVVCAGSEKTYDYFKALIAEVVEIFPCKYFHMGGDELYFGDFPTWNWKPNWTSCKVCKKKMEEEGIDSVQDLYYYVLRRVHGLLAEQGKTMIVWNDQLDNSREVPLPKDIVVQFWRIAHAQRGPREGCTYHGFEKQGFQTICSPFEYCYVDREEYANPEKTAAFDFIKYEGEPKRRELILGSEACAWEYGNPKETHYELSFTSSTILLLAKAWNGESVAYDSAYRAAFSKLILGVEVPENYDLFELFGSIMPPRLNDKWTYALANVGAFSKEHLAWHKQILSGISHTYSKRYLQKLVEALTTALNA